MKLNNRLATIASFVSSGAILVDIGCDHGFLCISLASDNKITHAYASDVNEGPLNNVKSNVNKYQLNNKITCILSNGLEKYDDVEFSDLVVAGMGGSLIVDILSAKISLLKDKKLILQPNTNSYGLRKWLLANGFKIDDERLVEDSDIIYEVIVASFGESSEYSELELLFGRVNLMQKTKILNDYLAIYIHKNENILSSIPIKHENREQFSKRINLAKEFLNENK